MKTLISILLLSFFFSLAQADIRPEHSGAWYNHDQAGHGLSIQVLDDERTIAFWFTYTPYGFPMFLVINGINDGQVELERLSYVAWLECDDVAAELTGKWQVEFIEADGGPYSVTVDANGAFEFYDALACRWEGHIHVQSMERGYLTARFGSPTCPWPVPILFASGRYNANGAEFCSSGGSCISYDQAMTLVSEWYEGRTIGLIFLRDFLRLPRSSGGAFL
jgi:hypothetical protein